MRRLDRHGFARYGGGRDGSGSGNIGRRHDASLIGRAPLLGIADRAWRSVWTPSQHPSVRIAQRPRAGGAWNASRCERCGANGSTGGRDVSTRFGAQSRRRREMAKASRAGLDGCKNLALFGCARA
ncbi:hypothetical protein LG3211_0157 [Lysobacter gummosus]|nr:hypothetical protein LG3211_0157 [Lysobacter gummosus]